MERSKDTESQHRGPQFCPLLIMQTRAIYLNIFQEECPRLPTEHKQYPPGDAVNVN